MKTFEELKNFTTNPHKIYVSKKTGKIYPLNEDKAIIDLDKPLTGISLLLYRFEGENNDFKVYDLKK